jgi:hypothetical protein
MSRKRTLAALALFAFAACQSKERPAASADSASAQGSDTTTAAAPAPAATEVVVHATNYKFDAPGEIPAGLTNFRFVNDGPGFHHLQLVRIDSGKTFDDFQKALRQKGPPPRWAVFVGGVNAPDPKSEANATLDLQPGTYAILCLVDIPEHAPHFTKGMIRQLTVGPTYAARGPAPKADVTVKLHDYSFDLSKPLSAGKQTFEVRTDAPQPHEIEVLRLAPGKTADDVLKWMGGPMTTPPPGQALGGVSGLVPGAPPVYFTADITPGDYVLICFLPDAKDGKPHFAHGMVKTVKVS